MASGHGHTRARAPAAARGEPEPAPGARTRAPLSSLLSALYRAAARTRCVCISLNVANARALKN